MIASRRPCGSPPDRWRASAVALLAIGLVGAVCVPRPLLGSERESLNEVRALIQDGRYAKAEVRARDLLASTEQSSGPNSTEVAAVLDLLVESLFWGGKPTVAETFQLAERSLAIRENHPGGDPRSLGRSLYNLGAIVYFHSDYERARAILERSLAVRDSALGSGHPDVAESYWLLGELFLDTGESELARESIERSLAIREDCQDQLGIAASLNTLGKVHYLRGDYEEARPLFERALEIRRNELRRDHPVTAKSLHNVASVCMSMGEYRRAGELEEEALRIQMKELGRDHPIVGYCHAAVAALQYALGDYVKARASYQAARAILASDPETRDARFAEMETTFALMLEEIGDTEEAKRLHEDALAIRRKDLGELNASVASSHCQLGRLHLSEGDTAAARSHFEKALAIDEEVLEPDSMDWIQTLYGLAALHQEAGNLEEAERLGHRSLEIARANFGSAHYRVLDLLPFQAGVSLREGDFDGARRLYREAMAIVERIPGPNAPAVAEIERGDALALALLGDRDKAFETAIASARTARDQVVVTARVLPERQGLAYTREIRQGLDLVLSILDAGPDPAPEEKAKAWDTLVRVRALVLDEMASRHAALHEGDDPDLRRATEELHAARQRLANLVVRGPGDLPDDHYAGLLDESRRQVEQMEETLAARNLDLRPLPERNAIGLDDVLAHLPDGSSIVAFIRFDRTDVSWSDADSGPWDAHAIPAYGAFVAGSARDEPVWVNLGPAAEIDALVAEWRAQIVAVGAPWTSLAAAEAACRESGAALRTKVWDALSDHLAGRVFVVPDGSLCRVAFAALPIGEERYLVEAGPEIHLLSAEKDIVPQGGGAPPGYGLLALGGADFEHSKPTHQLLAQLEEAPSAGTFRGSTTSCRELQSIVFEPLPSTEREIDDIIEIWSQREQEPLARALDAQGSGGEHAEILRLTGTDASEEALKRLAPGKGILHLATHGFFLDGRCASATEAGTRGIGGIAPVGAHTIAPPVGENPLRLSGLALAGANRRAEVSPDADDGILTAEEIATLDLAGLEWVVLSACDTGLGEIRTGEGIIGLRRGFRIAGARTLIMSLWSVEDRSARQWMRALYEGRFVEGLDTAAAVHRAALSTLEARRARGESSHPFFWAAFVASGDWR